MFGEVCCYTWGFGLCSVLRNYYLDENVVIKLDFMMIKFIKSKNLLI